MHCSIAGAPQAAVSNCCSLLQQPLLQFPALVVLAVMGRVFVSSAQFNRLQKLVTYTLKILLDRASLQFGKYFCSQLLPSWYVVSFMGFPFLA